MELEPRKSPQQVILHQFLMEKMPCLFSVLHLRLVSKISLIHSANQKYSKLHKKSQRKKKRILNTVP